MELCFISFPPDSGAVFQGFNDSAMNNTIPHHVKYYLRMDSSMVANTDKYKKV